MPIEVNHLTYRYGKKTPNVVLALDDVSLKIEDHSFNAIIGETGSGKSTLVQNLNALIIPDSGEVIVDEFHIGPKKSKNKKIKELRKHIGLVFQFPEYQLFEETILKDVSFGLKNYGYKTQDANEKAKKALALVGIGEEYYERSPFELSGGEKRRIAIAGILAMEPDILVLDEPTAGLDPEGSNIILSLIENLYKDGKTIILVTHNMNIVMEYCKRALVLHQGKIVFDGTPNELFDSLTNEMAIDMPPLYKFILELRQKGFNIEPNSIHNAEELAFAIKKELRK